VLGLLVVCFLIAGCQTDPATDVGPNEATLGGTAACPGAGANGYVWFQVRPAGGAFTDATPRRRFECSAQTADVAIPDVARGLAPGTTYDFRMAVLFDNGNFSTWDSAGTQEGTAFDHFTTRREPILDDLGTGAHNTATASRIPDVSLRTRARQSGERFWA